MWKKELDVGLTGPMLCARFFGHEMYKKKNFRNNFKYRV